MKKTLLAAVVVAGLGAGSVQAAPIYNATTDHYYDLTPVGTWGEAELAAQGMGSDGHLVTINDQAEQDWLLDTFGTDPIFWIGFNDIESEGDFVWSSGQTPAYTNWIGDPNDAGSGEDAVSMNWGEGGSWNDVPVDDLYLGIAEWSEPSASVPGPGSLGLLIAGLFGMGFLRSRKS